MKFLGSEVYQRHHTSYSPNLEVCRRPRQHAPLSTILKGSTNSTLPWRYRYLAEQRPVLAPFKNYLDHQEPIMIEEVHADFHL